MFAYMCTCVLLCVWVRVYVCVYMCICLCICACVYVHVRVHLSAHVYMCACMRMVQYTVTSKAWNSTGPEGSQCTLAEGSTAICRCVWCHCAYGNSMCGACACIVSDFFQHVQETFNLRGCSLSEVRSRVLRFPAGGPVLGSPAKWGSLAVGSTVVGRRRSGRS